MALFNKQRYQHLRDRFIKHYLIYAIGEIILVVIGILIALWINNTNQKRQVLETTNDLGEQILQEVDSDIEDVEEYLSDLEVIDQSFLKSLKRPYDSTKVDSKSLFPYVYFSLRDLSLNNRITSIVENNTFPNTEVSEAIYKLNSSYQFYLEYMEEVEEIIIVGMSENIKYLQNNETWYVDFLVDRKCGNDCVDYFINSYDFQARIASLRLLYVDSYGNIIKNFLKEIKSERDLLEKSLAEHR